MVELKELSYKNILKNISYKFESSKITSIVGPSGSGKTLLFNIITNLVKDYDGSILINNKDVRKLSKEDYRKIGYLFQYPSDQLFQNTVYEEISFGLKHYHYKENKKKLSKIH